MLKSGKTQQAVLKKLNIEKLNEMQEAAQLAIHSNKDVIILSPTGTGKTLAFLLPLLQLLDAHLTEIQALVLVPSRELAIQIEQVAREIGSGYKIYAFYGGRPGQKDRADLKNDPALIIGTPGRIADHIRRDNLQLKQLKMFVLDEFDKALEVGFEEDMANIIEALPGGRKNVLTSASKALEVPNFVGLNQAKYLNYLKEGNSQLSIKTVISNNKDKLNTLIKTLCHLGKEPGIVFCNYRDSVERLSEFLKEKNIRHGCFYGGMEQRDRERALIKFRNGTHRLIIATDLAARGIDVPEIKNIIHYQLPHKAVEFTHRNGRTARMHRQGTAYILKWTNENLPDFVESDGELNLEERAVPEASSWETLFISGGKKDKISKGDIAGLFFKQGNLKKDELGVIELKQDCAFVAVKKTKVKSILRQLNAVKLKTKKVKITLV